MVFTLQQRHHKGISMLETKNNPIIAVDGGGTTCRIAYADGTRQVLVETGPANVTSDYDGAIVRLKEGLAELAAGLDVSPELLKRLPAYLGLAGVTGDRIARRVAADLPLEAVRVEDDRHPALAGAHGAADGAIAHCGTGSFMAYQSQSVRRFAGGWGPVLGDEASAQWVGRRALAVTLDAWDGLAAKTALTDALLKEYGGTDGIVAFASDAKPHEFGQIARLVTAAAASGDGIAASLMRDAAGHLLQGLEMMGWTPAMPLCLTGGIGPHYAAFLPENAQNAVTKPKGAPIDGAITLARAFQAELSA
ncbi:BadF/BadG/BcrA/BcrD ATPase family protein [Leisingera sp. SS27]|uniref:BadF/BadG/BcrA/BcrD ATPase family protein n=1 Tax=Leisingera sp. SS27 TaxID=2979462 RepID=UPI0023306E2D|nr:BadF/BadG/BcrA/BcrD ATPase family protein [Leisingera sp. SS27]MDC0657780.1 BadF/BadG/BcrA/BcrD ATPase family protein [Leisingera sp. SS27]